MSLLALGSCGKIEVTKEPSAANASTPAGVPGAPSARERQAALQISPEEYFAHAGEASKSGDNAGAIRLYRKALALDPQMTRAHFALGLALVPSASAAALGSGTKDPKVLALSIEHLRQAQTDEPDNPEFAYWLGRVLDVAGKEEESIALLQRATQLNPEHGKAHKRLGLVYNQLGQHDEAEAAWLRAAELLPADGGVLFNLGNLHFEDDLDKSSEFYRRCTEVDPTFSKGYLGLSKTLAQRGDLEGAEAARKLFEVYQAHGKRLKALVHVASEAPEDEAAQFAVAEMYFALGQFDFSMNMLRRVLKLNPKNAFAHFYVGKIYTQEGNLDAALNHFEECVFHEPGVPDSLLALLETCIAMENELRIDEVCMLLEPLVDSVDHHARFADLLLQVGRTEEAEAHQSKAKMEDE